MTLNHTKRGGRVDPVQIRSSNGWTPFSMISYHVVRPIHNPSPIPFGTLGERSVCVSPKKAHHPIPSLHGVGRPGEAPGVSFVKHVKSQKHGDRVKCTESGTMRAFHQLVVLKTLYHFSFVLLQPFEFHAHTLWGLQPTWGSTPRQLTSSIHP